MTERFTLPGDNFKASIDDNLARNDNTICLCEKCASHLVWSFTQDVVKTSNEMDSDNAAALDLIIRACFRAWNHLGLDPVELVKQIVCLANPQAEHMNIYVKVTPLTEEQAQLHQTKPQGRA